MPLRNITIGNGVPGEFTNQSGNGKSLLIQKGQLNKFRLRPQVLNEHAESAREIQATVDATTITGQIFKASQDNINGIKLTMASAAGSSLDDFESYANSAALQAVWVGTNGSFLATLETTIIEEGAQAMSIPLNAVVNDEWQDTIGAADYTGYTFEFSYRQNKIFSQAGISFFIGDGTNTKSISLTIADIDSWETFDVDENAMTDDGGTPPTMTAITEIGFRLDNRQNGGIGYIDGLSAIPAPGSVQVKLWDFGTSIPTTAVDTLDGATQYTELGDRGLNSGAVAAEINVQLLGGLRGYQLNSFVAGVALEIPSNTTLVVDNYYAITIHYVDTDVSIYGPEAGFTTNYYTNGYAFTTPNTATAITAVGTYSDLMFEIYSTQDVYITTYIQAMVNSSGGFASPGLNSQLSSHIEDSNMSILHSITTLVPVAADITLDFQFRPMFMPKGSKFEVYLNDDFTDDLFAMGGAIGYLYEPAVVHG